MATPENLKYTKSHEWVKQEPDGTLSVGITHHAQEMLGDLVFVEAPAAGRKLKEGEECAVVESVKAAADIYALDVRSQRARLCNVENFSILDNDCLIRRNNIREDDPSIC